MLERLCVKWVPLLEKPAWSRPTQSTLGANLVWIRLNPSWSFTRLSHSPHTLPSPVRAWVKTNAEWSNADSRFSTPSQLHTLNLSWCQDLRRWWPLMTPVRENNWRCFVVRGGRFHLLKALPSATSREITHFVINYLFSGSLASIHVHWEMAILIPNKCALSGSCHCQHAGLSWVQVIGQ